jgi:hypothetical protein
MSRFQVGRTPLHWAARNRHHEVYNFLKPLTTDASRLDIYGISAESFFPDDESTDVTYDNLTSPPLSPLSLSSLTLHTISLSTTENSPVKRHPGSPRAMDVSLRPQFCSPAKEVVLSRHQSSIPLMSISERSPFLVEEKSLTDGTEVEWEPWDEKFTSHSRSVESLDDESKILITRQAHLFSVPDSAEDQMSVSEMTASSSDNLRSSFNQSPSYSSLPPLTIDTSQDKSKRFYSLRRKISMMLFNVHDDDFRGVDEEKTAKQHQEQVDNENEEENGSQTIEKKKKSYLRKLLFDSSKKRMVTHSHSMNPLNGTGSGKGYDNAEEDDDESEEGRLDPKLTEFHTPLSQSTTLSTNSDDQLSVKGKGNGNWISWRRFDRNKKSGSGLGKNHHRSNSETSVESAEMQLFSIQPFRTHERE